MMDTLTMLRVMSQQLLSAADLKAIAKVRGFSNLEATSRTAFEAVYLSPVGLTDAFADLTPPELSALHLLRWQNEVVSITFFQPVYPAEKDGYHTSFSQQYRPVLTQVQNRLVRRGLLLFGEAATSAATKMERWRFRFPREFWNALPPLLKGKPLANAALQVNDPFRAELMAVARRQATTAAAGERVTLKNKSLSLGQKPFSADGLQQWRFHLWEAKVRGAYEKWAAGQLRQTNRKQDMWYEASYTRSFLRLPPPGLLLDLFRSLPDNTAAEASQLEALISRYVQKPPFAAEICHAAWESGLLARAEIAGQFYYRLNEPVPAENPAAYLPSGGVIDTATIPYPDLEHLGQIGDLGIENGRLKVVPNIVKLAGIDSEKRAHPLTRWLETHHPAFGEALERIKRQWGKVIVHENLLVARVSDLSLRVKLERQFGSQVVMLDETHIAFPRQLWGEIEKFLKKAGQVVKWINR